MKNVFREALNETFDLSAMLNRINYHHVRGNLTDNDREELVNLAREKANPSVGVDVMAKLQELEARVKALEEGKQESGETEESVEEYQPGKWYYAGDKVAFNGMFYTCIAPDGVACVWSPADYPAYWEEI